MSTRYCGLCDQDIEDYNWRNKDWRSDGNDFWACSRHFTPSPHEFLPQSMKDDRKKYNKELTQPYLPDGSFNGAFKRHYPDISKDMVKEGAITQRQLEKAKEYKL